METPSNTQEQNPGEQKNSIPEAQIPHPIRDIFELMDIGKKIDRALGEGKNANYEPWKPDF